VIVVYTELPHLTSGDLIERSGKSATSRKQPTSVRSRTSFDRVVVTELQNSRRPESRTQNAIASPAEFIYWIVRSE
jgi:hypothetical protein